ncbi:hypothetical protein [Anaerorhabdus furcosa]|uniref:Uncharacterized protein n=1 Tax=Anaerorhabdus furcosa TaxID=118967 RepID=A0A1T4LDY0_9FIRM|nr:hypothetical protein [Anaerorhabdus furcosa]SJZ52821.1 hypothetical protein SAMN02745191_0842 [Anaerorhabdus furcosa]
MGRIKFYSNQDLSIGYYLKKIVRYLEKFDKSEVSLDINLILELHNVKKYFNDDLIKRYDIEVVDLWYYESNNINQIIDNLLKQIDNSNLKNYLEQTEKIYIEDFFELFSSYNIYRKIDSQIIYEIAIAEEIYLSELLKNDTLVKYYDIPLKNSLLISECSIKLLLNQFAIEHTIERKKTYFPKSLTKKDIDQIINEYLERKEHNLGYLQVLYRTDSKKLKVSDRAKSKILKRMQELETLLFNGETTIKNNIEIKFEHFNGDAVIISDNPNEWKFLYNANWIDENLDYNTLLQNFYTLFLFCDSQMRWSLISKKTQIGTFESIITIRTISDYKTNLAFKLLNTTADFQMQLYTSYLENKNIKMERIIEWFFETYLKDEFQVENFNITMSNEESLYCNKCKIIATEIDRCIKEFNLFVEDGCIDYELLTISSSVPTFKNVKSLVKKKYIYQNEEKTNFLFYCLFSNQCMLAYTEKFEEKYGNFFDLIFNEEVKISDISKYELDKIDFLLKSEVIILTNQDTIKFRNIQEILIMLDLYKNEFLVYWHHSEMQRELIDNLIEKQYFTLTSTLFSEQEADYLDFYLNNRKFCNGFQLRNRYIHGSYKPNADIDYSNYMKLTRLFIMIIIKINDDFCLKEKEEC